MSISGGEKAVSSASVAFDLNVFSLECVKRASYRVTSNASIEITVNDSIAVCVIHFSKPVSNEAAELAAESLRLEVLDQDLRFAVAAETAHVRNAVLALAFSRSGLQEVE
ncbi:His-Xaa-Ser system protein HxsD [Rhizobium sp. NLR12b]|uniref:His-Xaa-Ser system protein HxsD n=1 Tax=Rhizobium sp. NLR12b TaxID=2731108 RepID=UPI001C829847|nr:His-Xaa-Ser system protein HxsD [Rhizobium sp. NLR12b]MBX5302459.1 His-Xaa-Ser system protein HxsD [Rhizobium sp. NLR12b]